MRKTYALWLVIIAAWIFSLDFAKGAIDIPSDGEHAFAEYTKLIPDEETKEGQLKKRSLDYDNDEEFAYLENPFDSYWENNNELEYDNTAENVGISEEDEDSNNSGGNQESSSGQAEKYREQKKQKKTESHSETIGDVIYNQDQDLKNRDNSGGNVDEISFDLGSGESADGSHNSEYEPNKASLDDRRGHDNKSSNASHTLEGGKVNSDGSGNAMESSTQKTFKGGVIEYSGNTDDTTIEKSGEGNKQSRQSYGKKSNKDVGSGARESEEPSLGNEKKEKSFVEADQDYGSGKSKQNLNEDFERGRSDASHFSSNTEGIKTPTEKPNQNPDISDDGKNTSPDSSSADYKESSGLFPNDDYNGENDNVEPGADVGKGQKEQNRDESSNQESSTDNEEDSNEDDQQISSTGNGDDSNEDDQQISSTDNEDDSNEDDQQISFEGSSQGNSENVPANAVYNDSDQHAQEKNTKVKPATAPLGETANGEGIEHSGYPKDAASSHGARDSENIVKESTSDGSSDTVREMKVKLEEKGTVAEDSVKDDDDEPNADDSAGTTSSKQLNDESAHLDGEGNVRKTTEENEDSVNAKDDTSRASDSTDNKLISTNGNAANHGNDEGGTSPADRDDENDVPAGRDVDSSSGTVNEASKIDATSDKKDNKDTNDEARDLEIDRKPVQEFGKGTTETAKNTSSDGLQQRPKETVESNVSPEKSKAVNSEEKAEGSSEDLEEDQTSQSTRVGDDIDNKPNNTTIKEVTNSNNKETLSEKIQKGNQQSSTSESSSSVTTDIDQNSNKGSQDQHITEGTGESAKPGTVVEGSSGEAADSKGNNEDYSGMSEHETEHASGVEEDDNESSGVEENNKQPSSLTSNSIDFNNKDVQGSSNSQKGPLVAETAAPESDKSNEKQSVEDNDGKHENREENAVEDVDWHHQTRENSRNDRKPLDTEDSSKHESNIQQTVEKKQGSPTNEEHAEQITDKSGGTFGSEKEKPQDSEEKTTSDEDTEGSTGINSSNGSVEKENDEKPVVDSTKAKAEADLQREENQDFADSDSSSGDSASTEKTSDRPATQEQDNERVAEKSTSSSSEATKTPKTQANLKQYESQTVKDQNSKSSAENDVSTQTRQPENQDFVDNDSSSGDSASTEKTSDRPATQEQDNERVAENNSPSSSEATKTPKTQANLKQYESQTAKDQNSKSSAENDVSTQTGQPENQDNQDFVDNDSSSGDSASNEKTSDRSATQEQGNERVTETSSSSSSEATKTSKTQANLEQYESQTAKDQGSKTSAENDVSTQTSQPENQDNQDFVDNDSSSGDSASTEKTSDRPATQEQGNERVTEKSSSSSSEATKTSKTQANLEQYESQTAKDQNSKSSAENDVTTQTNHLENQDNQDFVDNDSSSGDSASNEKTSDRPATQEQGNERVIEKSSSSTSTENDVSSQTSQPENQDNQDFVDNDSSNGDRASTEKTSDRPATQKQGNERVTEKSSSSSSEATKTSKTQANLEQYESQTAKDQNSKSSAENDVTTQTNNPENQDNQDFVHNDSSNGDSVSTEITSDRPATKELGNERITEKSSSSSSEATKTPKAQENLEQYESDTAKDQDSKSSAEKDVSTQTGHPEAELEQTDYSLGSPTTKGTDRETSAENGASSLPVNSKTVTPEANLEQAEDAFPLKNKDQDKQQSPPEIGLSGSSGTSKTDKPDENREQEEDTDTQESNDQDSNDTQENNDQNNQQPSPENSPSSSSANTKIPENEEEPEQYEGSSDVPTTENQDQDLQQSSRNSNSGSVVDSKTSEPESELEQGHAPSDIQTTNIQGNQQSSADSMPGSSGNSQTPEYEAALKQSQGTSHTQTINDQDWQGSPKNADSASSGHYVAAKQPETDRTDNVSGAQNKAQDNKTIPDTSTSGDSNANIEEGKDANKIKTTDDQDQQQSASVSYDNSKTDEFDANHEQEENTKETTEDQDSQLDSPENKVSGSPVPSQAFQPETDLQQTEDAPERPATKGRDIKTSANVVLPHISKNVKPEAKNEQEEESDTPTAKDQNNKQTPAKNGALNSKTDKSGDNVEEGGDTNNEDQDYQQRLPQHGASSTSENSTALKQPRADLKGTDNGSNDQTSRKEDKNAADKFNGIKTEANSNQEMDNDTKTTEGQVNQQKSADNVVYDIPVNSQSPENKGELEQDKISNIHSTEDQDNQSLPENSFDNSKVTKPQQNAFDSQSKEVNKSWNRKETSSIRSKSKKTKSQANLQQTGEVYGSETVKQQSQSSVENESNESTTGSYPDTQETRPKTPVINAEESKEKINHNVGTEENRNGQDSGQETSSVNPSISSKQDQSSTPRGNDDDAVATDKSKHDPGFSHENGDSFEDVPQTGIQHTTLGKIENEEQRGNPKYDNGAVDEKDIPDHNQGSAIETTQASGGQGSVDNNKQEGEDSKENLEDGKDDTGTDVGGNVNQTERESQAQTEKDQYSSKSSSKGESASSVDNNEDLGLDNNSSSSRIKIETNERHAPQDNAFKITKISEQKNINDRADANESKGGSSSSDNNIEHEGVTTATATVFTGHHSEEKQSDKININKSNHGSFVNENVSTSSVTATATVFNKSRKHKVKTAKATESEMKRPQGNTLDIETNTADQQGPQGNTHEIETNNADQQRSGSDENSVNNVVSSPGKVQNSKSKPTYTHGSNYTPATNKGEDGSSFGGSSRGNGQVPFRLPNQGSTIQSSEPSDTFRSKPTSVVEETNRGSGNTESSQHASLMKPSLYKSTGNGTEQQPSLDNQSTAPSSNVHNEEAQIKPSTAKETLAHRQSFQRKGKFTPNQHMSTSNPHEQRKPHRRINGNAHIGKSRKIHPNPMPIKNTRYNKNSLDTHRNENTQPSKANKQRDSSQPRMSQLRGKHGSKGSRIHHKFKGSGENSHKAKINIKKVSDGVREKAAQLMYLIELGSSKHKPKYKHHHGHKGKSIHLKGHKGVHYFQKGKVKNKGHSKSDKGKPKPVERLPSKVLLKNGYQFLTSADKANPKLPVKPMLADNYRNHPLVDALNKHPFPNKPNLTGVNQNRYPNFRPPLSAANAKNLRYQQYLKAKYQQWRYKYLKAKAAAMYKYNLAKAAQAMKYKAMMARYKGNFYGSNKYQGYYGKQNWGYQNSGNSYPGYQNQIGNKGYAGYQFQDDMSSGKQNKYGSGYPGYQNQKYNSGYSGNNGYPGYQDHISNSGYQNQNANAGYAGYQYQDSPSGSPGNQGNPGYQTNGSPGSQSRYSSNDSPGNGYQTAYQANGPPAYQTQYQGAPATQYQGAPATQYQGAPATQYQGTPATQYQGTPAIQSQENPSTQYQDSPSQYKENPSVQYQVNPTTQSKGNAATQYQDSPSQYQGNPAPQYQGNPATQLQVNSATQPQGNSATQYSPSQSQGNPSAQYQGSPSPAYQSQSPSPGYSGHQNVAPNAQNTRNPYDTQTLMKMDPKEMEEMMKQLNIPTEEPDDDSMDKEMNMMMYQTPSTSAVPSGTQNLNAYLNDEAADDVKGDAPIQCLNDMQENGQVQPVSDIQGNAQVPCVNNMQGNTQIQSVSDDTKGDAPIQCLNDMPDNGQVQPLNDIQGNAQVQCVNNVKGNTQIQSLNEDIKGNLQIQSVHDIKENATIQSFDATKGNSQIQSKENSSKPKEDRSETITYYAEDVPKQFSKVKGRTNRKNISYEEALKELNDLEKESSSKENDHKMDRLTSNDKKESGSGDDGEHSGLGEKIHKPVNKKFPWKDRPLLHPQGVVNNFFLDAPIIFKGKNGKPFTLSADEKWKLIKTVMLLRKLHRSKQNGLTKKIFHSKFRVENGGKKTDVNSVPSEDMQLLSIAFNAKPHFKDRKETNSKSKTHKDKIKDGYFKVHAVYPESVVPLQRLLKELDADYLKNGFFDKAKSARHHHKAKMRTVKMKAHVQSSARGKTKSARPTSSSRKNVEPTYKGVKPRIGIFGDIDDDTVDKCKMIGKSAFHDRCPDGWVPHNEFCYGFYKSKSPWREFPRKCAEHNAVLAMPKTEEELGFLHNFLKSRSLAKDAFHIGLAKRKGAWSWIDDSPYLMEADFNDVDLDSKTEVGNNSCGVVLNGHIRNEDCKERRSYICEVKRGMESVRILAFGDSLTKGFYGGGNTYHPYTSKLEYLLNKDSHKCYIIDNEGKDGELASDMTTRLKSYLNNDTSWYSWVIVLSGTNDIIQDHSKPIAKNWDKIVHNIIMTHQEAHKRGFNTVVVTIPETDCEETDNKYCLKKQKERQYVNDRLRHYALETGAAVLSDLAVLLPRYSMETAKRNFFWEGGIHMRPQGYDRMAEILYQDIVRNIEEK